MTISYDKVDRTSSMQRAMGSAVSTASDELSDAATKVQNQAQEQIDRLSSSIRSKPIQSAAIAAGLGFLFAVIARR